MNKGLLWLILILISAESLHFHEALSSDPKLVALSLGLSCLFAIGILKFSKHRIAAFIGIAIIIFIGQWWKTEAYALVLWLRVANPFVRWFAL